MTQSLFLNGTVIIANRQRQEPENLSERGSTVKPNKSSGKRPDTVPDKLPDKFRTRGEEKR